MKVSTALAALSFTLAFSASCLAKNETGPKNEISIGDLMADPKAYEGKDVTIRCTVTSVDLGSAYCGEGNRNVSLSSRTMDKATLAFLLAHCAKPKESDNDPRCQNLAVAARLKNATIPGWLDNAKIKIKGMKAK